MYNEERKRDFLKDTSFDKNGMSVWFDRVEKLEKQKNKDVSEFSKEEAVEVIKSVNSSSWKYLKHVLYFFRSYANWCLENSYIESNGFGNISPIELKEFLNDSKVVDSVVERDGVLNWIRNGAIENARDQFCVLCMFEGVKGSNYEEIVDLTRADMFQEGTQYFFMINRFKNGSYNKVRHEVSEDLYNIALKAYSTVVYISGTSYRLKKYYLKNSEKVFKEFYNTSSEINDDNRGRAIYGSLNRTLKSLYKKNVIRTMLKPKDIFFSGIINDIKKYASEKNITAHEALYSDYIKNIEDKFNTTIEPTDYDYRYFDYLD